jgi:hypothetical protein
MPVVPQDHMSTIAHGNDLLLAYLYGIDKVCYVSIL